MDQNLPIRAAGQGVEIRVKAVPGASRDRIAGLLGDALKVQIAAAPERGKANAAIEALLARKLGVSRKAVSVIGGKTGPRKVVHVSGVTVSRARAALGL